MKKTIFIFLFVISNLTWGQNNLEFVLNKLQYYSFNDTLNIEDISLIIKRYKVRQLYIKRIEKEIDLLNKKIDYTNSYLSNLKNKLQLLTQNYSNVLYFLYLYKRTFNNLSIYLLSTKNIKQLTFRIQYLKLLIIYLKNTINSIISIQKEINQQLKQMNKSKTIRKKLLKKLLTTKNLQKEDFIILQNINKNSAPKQFILKEIKQNDLLKKILQNSTQTDNNEPLNNIEKMKGQLPAPIKNPIIIIPFGIYQHPKLKNIKIKNDGIDIISINDTIVKSIYKGTISNIVTLPNGKYAVIIKHGNYFSVYSNLDSLLITEKEQINTNEPIGIIRFKHNNHVNTLNFQLWFKTKKLNPINWIKI